MAALMHLGLIAPESPSHLETAASIGAALQARGHRVTCFGLADAAGVAAARGLGFVALAPGRYPAGTVAARLAPLSTSSGLSSALRTMALFREAARIQIDYLPDALARAGIEGLVADQLCPGASTAAELAGVRFVNFCNALPIHQHPDLPPFFTGWGPSRSAPARLRNRAGYAFFNALNGSIRRVVNAGRRARGLAPLVGPGAGLSSLLQLGQLPPELDFPGELPRCFRRVGPLQDRTVAQEGDWDDAWRDGRPLVYASFGTVNNRLHPLYQAVLDAFRGAPFQLCVSAGGGPGIQSLRAPEGTLVLDRAPQRRILQQAVAFITHAGVNSSLEALQAAVPMVAIPLTNDQPAMAARLAHHGAAIVVARGRASLPRIRAAVELVIAAPSYRKAVSRLGAVLAALPGLPGAAELIELALRSGSIPEPTMREEAPRQWS